MIKELAIWNYKSFKEAVLPLSRVTFLIGANASGKSNALEVLRLAGWLGQGLLLGEIEKRLGEVDSIRGGLRDLFAWNTGRQGKTPHSFRYRIALDSDQENVTFDQEVSLCMNASQAELLVITKESLESASGFCYRVKQREVPNLTDSINVEWNNHRQGKNPLVPCSNRRAIFLSIKEGVRFVIAKGDPGMVVPETAERFASALDNIVFIAPEVAKMRGYVQIQPGARLNEDGSNMSAVVYNICETVNRKKELIEFIKSLPEQDIKDIGFEKTKNNDVQVELHEGFGTSRKTPASLLSDGTLRALAIGAALYNAPKGAVVVIEEIDNGIHPSRARKLVEQLYQIADARDLQIVVTTHNPALMDAIPHEELQNVLCCYRSKDTHRSEVRRLGDMPTFLDLLAQGSLGRSATSESLEGWVTDKRSEADFISQRKGWLANFKKQNGVGK